MREAGEMPNDRLYRATALQTRDLATLLLVDVSESTRSGGVLDIERVAVALLADAMSRLGDPFALLAFASNGREQVRLTRIKGFAEPFAAPARARLAGLRPGLSTRLGAALRHAGAELAGVRSFRRLVLVLTDGEPSDIDVADPLDLVEDGRRAVLGLRARGIDSFAVVLGTHGAETAGRMFGRSARVALRRLDDLPARLSDLYFRLSRR
jgi:nitric oxide reductase activation protein